MDGILPEDGPQILIWISPQDFCAVGAAEKASGILLKHLLEKMDDIPAAIISMAMFHKFYENLSQKCDDLPGDLQSHRLMYVPRTLFVLLETLGFCTYQNAAGEWKTLTDKNMIPICKTLMKEHTENSTSPPVRQ